MSEENLKSKPKERISNLEILRLIAMGFIVASHYFVHNGLTTSDMPLSFNKLLIDSMDLGKLGVAIFVMITGYFMAKTKFNVGRIINIVLQTVFYSVAIYLVLSLTKLVDFSVVEMAKQFFPCITGKYWFVTTYILLACFIPFINCLLKTMTRKQYAILLTVLFFAFSFAPTFLGFDSLLFAGYFCNFVLWYCIGAYLRFYPDNLLSKKHCSNILSVILAIGLFLSSILIDVLGERFSFLHGKATKFYSIFSILVVLLAVCIVCSFVNMKPFYSKFINILGGATFGVYLIHDNSFMRIVLWRNVFNNVPYANSSRLIIHFIISVSIVFVACLVIEIIRKVLLEKTLFKPLCKLISKLFNMIIQYCENLFYKIKDSNFFN